MSTVFFLAGRAVTNISANPEQPSAKSERPFGIRPTALLFYMIDAMC